ncbi:RASF5 protein, partial [Polyodon spathula]|nr:RASF5 protein [Polyodon spathula]
MRLQKNLAKVLKSPVLPAQDVSYWEAPANSGERNPVGVGAGAPRCRKRGYRPPHVRTIFEPPGKDPREREERGEGHSFCGGITGAWCDCCCRYILQSGLVCSASTCFLSLSNGQGSYPAPLPMASLWPAVQLPSELQCRRTTQLWAVYRRVAHFFYRFPKMVSSSRRLKPQLLWKSADCKYTCHPYCRDLVTLDCHQNGKSVEPPLLDVGDHSNNSSTSSTHPPVGPWYFQPLAKSPMATQQWHDAILRMANDSTRAAAMGCGCHW